jgi:hypothetical protein
MGRLEEFWPDPLKVMPERWYNISESGQISSGRVLPPTQKTFFFKTPHIQIPFFTNIVAILVLSCLVNHDFVGLSNKMNNVSPSGKMMYRKLFLIVISCIPL